MGIQSKISTSVSATCIAIFILIYRVYREDSLNIHIGFDMTYSQLVALQDKVNAVYELAIELDSELDREIAKIEQTTNRNIDDEIK